MKKNILIIIMLLAISTMYGHHVFPISMEQKLEKSISIVEGTIVDKISFFSSPDPYTGLRDIYTENILQIGRILQGRQVSKKISVFTFGGQVGSKLQEWSNLLTLNIGDYGVFFLLPILKDQKETGLIFRNIKYMLATRFL